MGYTRGQGTNLLWPGILIYLACRECGNEMIIHRPKDESEFLAKKKTFEANIFKFFLKGEPSGISKFWGAANQNTYCSLCSTICNVYDSWKLFTCPTSHTPQKFPPFNPPPPRNFHWPSVGWGGGGGMDIFWNHTIHLTVNITYSINRAEKIN